MYEQQHVGEFQQHRVIPKYQVDRADDDFAVVAEINIRLRRNGAMSIEGMTSDKTFALAMIDNARDAIARQPDATQLIVPGNDVEVPDTGPRFS